jgi:uncharacterized protein YjiS (DUF1127 family)
MSYSHAPRIGARQALAEDRSKTGLLARLVAALAREWRIHRDLRVLQTLDDRALRDIGIGVGGLEHAVRHGRSIRAQTSVTAGFGKAPPRPPLSWAEWR